MATIQIDDDYRITSDQYQWILQKMRVVATGKRKGEVDWDCITYHASLKQSLSSYLERSLRLSEASSLKELQEVSDKCESKIDKLFKQLGD